MKEGYTIYITGLSGAGKSTLSKKVVEYLKNKGEKVQLIDGDIVRESLEGMFGYTKEERIKSSRVDRLICKLLNENGVIAIVATICGHNEIREKNKSYLKNYYEIFLSCPIQSCIEKDVKGLYKKALSGEEKNVIGIDIPYDIPEKPDLIIDTSKTNVEDSMDIIKNFIDNITK